MLSWWSVCVYDRVLYPVSTRRCNNVVWTSTTLLRRQNNVACLLGVNASYLSAMRKHFYRFLHNIYIMTGHNIPYDVGKTFLRIYSCLLGTFPFYFGQIIYSVRNETKNWKKTHDKVSRFVSEIKKFKVLDNSNTR